MEHLLPSLIYFLSFALILAGLVGAFFPSLPGAPLIFAGMLIYGIYDGFARVSPATFGILFFLTVLLSVVDYLSATYGAKKCGASKWGIAGAIIGAVAGLFIGNIFGFVLGPFIGAVTAELIVEGKDIRRALRAGGGAALGLLTGSVVKFTIALAMVLIFMGAMVF